MGADVDGAAELSGQGTRSQGGQLLASRPARLVRVGSHYLVACAREGGGSQEGERRLGGHWCGPMKGTCSQAVGAARLVQCPPPVLHRDEPPGWRHPVKRTGTVDADQVVLAVRAVGDGEDFVENRTGYDIALKVPTMAVNSRGGLAGLPDMSAHPELWRAQNRDADELKRMCDGDRSPVPGQNIVQDLASQRPQVG